jgi:[methyl-Co(III) methanol-specific corrinoid protein]:coenzyme M methyltransferase
MNDLTQKQRLLNVLFKKEVDRTPIVSFTQTGTIDLMKESGAFWPKANKDANAMADLGISAHKIAGFEAVRIPFGVTAEAEALGCKIDYHEDRIDFPPTCLKPVESLDAIKPVSPSEGNLSIIIKATELIKKQIGEVPIIVGVTGPFTIAGMIHGIDQTMKDLVLQPQQVHKAMEISSKVVINFSKALSEAGADIIVFIEPTASLIGPMFFKTFLLPYLKDVVKSVNLPTTLHVCGNSMPIMNLMLETGVKGISVDQKTSIIKMKEIVNRQAALIGNLDPVGVLLVKKPSDVENECKRILKEGVDILAPGCGLSPHTPLENLKAMVRAGKMYGAIKR